MKKRFEYKIFKIPTKRWGNPDEEQMIKLLNKEGIDGWEVSETLSSQGFVNSLLLKREI